MNIEQIKLLTQMKKLINEGKKRFEIRSDSDYLANLLELGICVEEAWLQILCLNNHLYFNDPKPFYHRKDDNTLTFKKIINGNSTYIKLRIEDTNDGKETVCLSFHIDR